MSGRTMGKVVRYYWLDHVTSHWNLRFYITAHAIVKEYNGIFKDTLLGTSSHKCWSVLKLLSAVDMIVPTLLKINVSLTHCPLEKEALFAVVFDSKQSNESSIMQYHNNFPKTKWTTFTFHTREIEKLLLELDACHSLWHCGIWWNSSFVLSKQTST